MALGFAEEVKGLYERGDLHINLPAIRSVGYRQLWDYCAGDCSLQDAVEKAVIATRQLAKRQLTWLRNWPQAIEIKADNQDEFLSTEKICNQSLKLL